MILKRLPGTFYGAWTTLKVYSWKRYYCTAVIITYSPNHHSCKVMLPNLRTTPRTKELINVCFISCGNRFLLIVTLWKHTLHNCSTTKTLWNAILKLSTWYFILFSRRQGNEPFNLIGPLVTQGNSAGAESLPIIVDLLHFHRRSINASLSLFNLNGKERPCK